MFHPDGNMMEAENEGHAGAAAEGPEGAVERLQIHHYLVSIRLANMSQSPSRQGESQYASDMDV